MKTKGVVKIILFSLLAVCLTALLAAGLHGDASLPFFSFGGNTYSEPESYTTGSGSARGKLTALDIDWARGDISLRLYDGDSILLTEDDVSDPDEQMRFRLRDGILTVHTRKSGLWWGSFPKKNLEILIPRACADALRSLNIDHATGAILLDGLTVRTLNIDAASAEVRASACSFTSVDIDAASGDCFFTDCTVDDFSMDAASGSADLSGSFGSIDLDSASGDLRLDASTAPTRVEVDTASGYSELLLPADTEFEAKLNTASGDLSVSGFQGEAHRKSFLCGSGRFTYSFDTASGDAVIRAK